MTGKYFKSRIHELNCPKPTLNQLKSLLYSSTEKIAKTFETKLKIPATRLEFSDIIQEILKNLDTADVELNIRLSKLKEVKKLKKELESKLIFIKTSINDLSLLSDLQSKAKLDLRDSQIRRDYYEQEKLKSKTTKKKLKLYQQEQQERSAKIQQHIDELTKELEADKNKEFLENHKKQQEKRKMYQEYLQKLREKAENRKKELKLQETLISSSVKAQKPKPLFVQLSERYATKIEMPELAKRKQELSQKRLFNSYSTKHILDHAQWYADYKKESGLKRKKDLNNKSADRKFQISLQNLSSWQVKILEDERLLREAKAQEQKEFLNRLDKKAQYSSLVKQIYSPNMQERKSFDGFDKRAKTERLKEVSNEGRAKAKAQAEWKPHVFKPNKMVPPQPMRKNFETIDYLKEFRARQKDEEEEKLRKEAESLMNELKAQVMGQSPKRLNVEQEEKNEKKDLKQETQKLDKEIMKKDRKITASSKVNLKLSQEVNEMYLSSIRAKLSFLENVSSN